MRRESFSTSFQRPACACRTAGKPGRTVVDVKGDSGFGGRKGMSDACLRIDLCKMVEDSLIRNLS